MLQGIPFPQLHPFALPRAMQNRFQVPLDPVKGPATLPRDPERAEGAEHQPQDTRQIQSSTQTQNSVVIPKEKKTPPLTSRRILIASLW